MRQCEPDGLGREMTRAGCGRQLGVPFQITIDVVGAGVVAYDCFFAHIDQNDPNLIRLTSRRPPCP